jgi:hypothetical protein
VYSITVKLRRLYPLECDVRHRLQQIDIHQTPVLSEVMNGSSVTSTMYHYASSVRLELSDVCLFPSLTPISHGCLWSCDHGGGHQRNRRPHEGDVPILHRYEALFSRTSPISSSSSVRTTPFQHRRSEGVRRHDEQTGIESADPPLESTGQGLSRWSHHRTYSFKSILFRQCASWRIQNRLTVRHVRNSEELQTSIWPRDSPNPILFAPYTMSFSHHTGQH